MFVPIQRAERVAVRRLLSVAQCSVQYRHNGVGPQADGFVSARRKCRGDRNRSAGGPVDRTKLCLSVSDGICDIWPPTRSCPGQKGSHRRMDMATFLSARQLYQLLVRWGDGVLHCGGQ